MKEPLKDDLLFEKIFRDVLDEAKELQGLPGIEQYIKFKLKILREIFNQEEVRTY